MRRLTAAPLCGALAVFLCLLTGCGLGSGIYSNYRALEDLQPLRALGADAAPGGVLLSALSRPAGDAEPAVCLRGGGAGLVSAMDSMQDALPQGKLFFAHMQYLVLGEGFAAAEAGVGGALDYIERDIHTRMGTGLFVLRGSDAAALFSDPDADPEARLAAIRSETARGGDSHVFDAREVAVALSEYGAALVCALTLRRTPEGKTLAVPDGYAVLDRDGRLAAFLDGLPARAAGFLLGVAGTFSETVSDGEGRVTLELGGGRADCAVSRAAPDALPELSVTLRAEAAVAAAEPGQDVTGAAVSEARCAAAAQTLRDGFLDALALSRALDADFLALGRVLRLHGADPARLPADWLQTLPVRVSCEVVPAHGYDMGQPVGTESGVA